MPFPITVEFGNGEKALIRPVSENDKTGLNEAMHSLSDRTKYLRFFTPKNTLSRSELHYLTHIDHTSHASLVCVSSNSEQPKIWGSCRYVITERQPEVIAELAITVEDNHQHLGIGRLLLEHLIHLARSNGVHQLLATVLRDNSGMRQFVESLSYPITQKTNGHAIDFIIDISYS